ncbi:unnamed protein product, partial [Mesorhabditis belari]|uniref:Uncharacterized protein n=1 Tax=Mesorhabditis belari TaxID=2138241 RepID=A0AAF3EBJ8_9BILA
MMEKELDVITSNSPPSEPAAKFDKACSSVGKFFKKISNKLKDGARFVARHFGVFEIWEAFARDDKYGTHRNVVETIARLNMEGVGACTGAAIGFVMGSLICPGIGTTIGWCTGAVTGTVVTGFLGSRALSWVLDMLRMDIEKRQCDGCEEFYHYRKYRGGKNASQCPSCEPRPFVISKLKFLVITLFSIMTLLIGVRV